MLLRGKAYKLLGLSTNVEVIKAYSVSLTAPKDLIEQYFKLKIALNDIFKREF
jgi:hypothetical protein